MVSFPETYIDPNVLLRGDTSVWIHNCIAGFKAFEDAVVEFRYVVRLSFTD